MTKHVIEVEQSKLDHIHKQLGYIRCWIDGFEAGGKKGPHSADVLRQVQLLLGDAKPVAAPQKPRQSGAVYGAKTLPQKPTL